MEKHKISVVVPVYNAKKWIERCVLSLRNQTYRNLEIILVDDGSNDGSGALCDEMAEADQRLLVIHQENGGQSKARNKGLEIATGDYVTFCDSDDWLAVSAYQYQMDLMREHDADVVQTAYYITGNEIVPALAGGGKIEILHGKEILQSYMTNSTLTGDYAVWDCLFRRSILEGLRFREGKLNEDIDFKYLALARCNIMVMSDKILYYYFQTGESSSGAPLKTKDFDLREAANLLMKITEKEEYGTIAYLGKVKQARTAMSLLSRIAFYGIDPEIDKDNVVDELIAENRNNLAFLLKSPIPLSRKILAVMFAINYGMTEKLVKVLKKYI